MEKAIEIKRRAQRCILSGDLDGALAEYEKLVASGDSDPYYWVLLADLLYKKGNPGTAQKRYLEAIDGYEKNSLYKNGIAVCKKMSRLSLAPIEVAQRLGHLYSLDGFRTEASLAFLQHADLLVRDDRFDEARQSLTRASQSTPDVGKPFERLGELEVLAGNPNAAARAWSEAADRFEKSGQHGDATRCRQRAEQAKANAPPEDAAASAPLAGEGGGIDLAPHEPSLGGFMETPAGLAGEPHPSDEGDAQTLELTGLGSPGHSNRPPASHPPLALAGLDPDEYDTRSERAPEPPAPAIPDAGLELEPVDEAETRVAPLGPVFALDLPEIGRSSDVETSGVEAPPRFDEAPRFEGPQEFEEPQELEERQQLEESQPFAEPQSFEPEPQSFEREPTFERGSQPAVGARELQDAEPALESSSPFAFAPPNAEHSTVHRESEHDAAPARSAERPHIGPEVFFASDADAEPDTSSAESAAPEAAAAPPAEAPAKPSMGIERFGDEATPARPALVSASAEASDTDGPRPAEDAGLLEVSKLLGEAQTHFHAGNRDGATLALIRAAQAYDHLKRYDSAAAIYRSLGHSPDVSLQLMMLWLKNCQYRDDRREAARVACDLGDRALNDGDVPSARDWFERARSYDGENEIVARRLHALQSGQGEGGVATMPAEATSSSEPPAAAAASGEGFVHVRTEQSEPQVLDLGALISEFRRAIEPELESDPQGHYDLGVSYQEMGLIEEAAESFRRAAQYPAFQVRAGELAGRCLLDLGRFDDAAQAMRLALEAPELPPSAAVDLRYHLGLALEAAGRGDEALAEFERVYAAQASYPDVAMKIRVLRKTTGAS